MPFPSARANFIEWCTTCYAFWHPKFHFIRLEAWFYVNGTLKYNKVTVFYSPKESLYWIWLSPVPVFEVHKSVCPFHYHGPILLSGVLLVMHFSTHKVHFIRLEAWFYVNGTLKYDKVFVFYSPKESLFWIWLSRVPVFEGPKSVCPFHYHRPTLLSRVLLVLHFSTPNSISLG